MITVKYNGGFGNQIFQYLMGVSLAKKLNTDVTFDMSFFKGRRTRKYDMFLFGIEKNENKDIRVPIYWKLRRLLKMPKRFLGLNIYNEKSFNFEERFNEIKDNTFVEGFFQSPKYFDENIARELEFKAPINQKTREIEEKMNNENAVSIHIRLGDYVKKARYNKVYNHLDENHYKRAIEIIKSKVDNPAFYVFSDEPDEAKQVLSLENAVYVTHNAGDDSWQDMYLMTRCKHNIIANSSFSYFGAYLNKNENKIVIAPIKWFQDPRKTTEDIYPNGWIRI